jgi:SulP family sulfate permease
VQLWFRDYRRENLPGDLGAGAVVAMMLVPQAMAYAMLAGLPPEMGLYASILPLLAYALFASSNFLAVGPVAIDSLMVASAAGMFAVQGSPQYNTVAMFLALLSGALLFCAGLLRFGVVANLLSHSVSIGFINAAALIIGVSQLQHLLGITLTKPDDIVLSLLQLWQRREEFSAWTGGLGIASVILLVLARAPLASLLRRIGVRDALISVAARTGAFAVILLTAFVVWLFNLHESHGIRVVGVVPGSLPSFSVPSGLPAPWTELLPAAALIAFVAYLESISVARSLAAKRRQRVDGNRELIALGVANMVAGLCRAYPVAGGVSRSSVNYSAGANTPLAGVVTAIGVAMCMLLLAPAMYFVPKAALAAVVIIAVLRLVDFEPMRVAWHYNRVDALATLVTFVTVLLVSVQAGLLTGIVFSLVVYLWRTLNPHIAVLGRVPGSEHFRNVLRHRVETTAQLAIVRIDESLYFANSHALEDRMQAIAAGQPELRHIVLVCSAVNYIDTSALDSLDAIRQRLRDAGVTLHLAEVKGPVLDRLERTAFVRQLAPGRLFISTHAAVTELENSSAATLGG